jgi:glycosyltransferase involved in cell wall biosynthesis
MEILYVSRLWSESRLAALLRELPVKPPQQEQKFHGLLARGLAANACQVTSLSTLPSQPNPGTVPSQAIEREKGITFRYATFRMIPFLSHVLVFAWGFFSGLRWAFSRRSGPKFVICDVLKLSIAAGALLAAKLTRTPAIAIVTDVPDYLHEYIGSSNTLMGRLVVRMYRVLSTFLMERYDGYILLTEAMNPLVNPHHRPHLVVEGMVDPDMDAVANTPEGKYPERVILYAGALYEKYGVRMLLDAFLRLPATDARLWLYGSGELETTIQASETLDPRIKYWGVRPNAEVVAAEVRAGLLVNPRPSTEAFTAFSFPSKNMEYMASGTPVLTTRLSGMPEEYLDHVYTFGAETVEGMAASLNQLLHLPAEELHAKGMAAKAFVLGNKSNVMQAARIRTFLQVLNH